MNCNATNEEFQGMDILVTQEDQFNNDNSQHKSPGENLE